jgi:hypothetical protein
MRRAVALQERYHFRYPLPDLVNARVTDESAEGSEVLTDDFAPVNLYEATASRSSRTVTPALMSKAALTPPSLGTSWESNRRKLGKQHIEDTSVTLFRGNDTEAG